MWEEIEKTIWMLALVAFGVVAFTTWIDIREWWQTPRAIEVSTEEMLKSVSGGDLVLCATALEDSEDGTITSMIVEMVMTVDIHRPISQELEGKILGKGSQSLDVKKYADFKVCEWIDIVKNEEKERDEIKNSILSRGTPIGAVFSNRYYNYELF